MHPFISDLDPCQHQCAERRQNKTKKIDYKRKILTEDALSEVFADIVEDKNPAALNIYKTT